MDKEKITLREIIVRVESARQHLAKGYPYDLFDFIKDDLLMLEKRIEEIRKRVEYFPHFKDSSPEEVFKKILGEEIEEIDELRTLQV